MCQDMGASFRSECFLVYQVCKALVKLKSNLLKSCSKLFKSHWLNPSSIKQTDRNWDSRRSLNKLRVRVNVHKIRVVKLE